MIYIAIIFPYIGIDALFIDHKMIKLTIPFAGLFPPSENQFPPNGIQFPLTENQFPLTENHFPLTENIIPYHV